MSAERTGRLLIIFTREPHTRPLPELVGPLHKSCVGPFSKMSQSSVWVYGFWALGTHIIMLQYCTRPLLGCIQVFLLLEGRARDKRRDAHDFVYNLYCLFVLFGRESATWRC